MSLYIAILIIVMECLLYRVTSRQVNNCLCEDLYEDLGQGFINAGNCFVVLYVVIYGCIVVLDLIDGMFTVSDYISASKQLPVLCCSLFYCNHHLLLRVVGG